MRSLFSKVSYPLKVWDTLNCIAPDTNYLNIYSHIYVEYRIQNRNMPTTKSKIQFSKVLQSLRMTKNKNKKNLLHLYIHLVKIFALILNSEIVFRKLF